MNMVLAWRKIRKNIQMKVLICRQWVVLEGEEIRSSPITIHCYVKAYPSISEYQNINLKNPISRWEGCGTSTLTWCRFHCGYTYIAFRRIPGRILQVTFRIPPFNTFQLLIGKYIYILTPFYLFSVTHATFRFGIHFTDILHWRV